MHNWAYKQIFRIIKESKDYSLEDLPSSFYDIMRAFDNAQHERKNGVQIVQNLIRDTRLWLSIIESNAGRDSPKFIVASNSLSHACIKLIDGLIDRLIKSAILSDFQTIRGPDIQNQVSEVEIALKRIGELYMTPELRKIHKNMVSKLALTMEYLNAEVPIS
ncbi:MAG: hypothetical protein IPP96_09410 [Chitinophagaceae bacterium]|nr:hypothetical protein [Chitinophagaceae bacterium]